MALLIDSRVSSRSLARTVLAATARLYLSFMYAAVRQRWFAIRLAIDTYGPSMEELMYPGDYTATPFPMLKGATVLSPSSFHCTQAAYKPTQPGVATNTYGGAEPSPIRVLISIRW